MKMNTTQTDLLLLMEVLLLLFFIFYQIFCYYHKTSDLVSTHLCEANSSLASLGEDTDNRDISSKNLETHPLWVFQSMQINQRSSLILEGFGLWLLKRAKSLKYRVVKIRIQT